jgi:hypothetical protein
MQSKITGKEANFLFSLQILNRYEVKYYQCQQTGFIQTEEPYWLDDAYESAITKLDVGIVHRNVHLVDVVETILVKYFDYRLSFLDYAGGYGLFTRLMRDKGFNFYNTDKFCQNVFAEYFDLSQLSIETSFELVTAFEVLEHLVDPIEEIKAMLRFSENLLFTTELMPNDINLVKDWYYMSPETGQHISFYNQETLKYLAKLFECNFYTNGKTIHLFTKKVLSSDPFFRPKVRDPFLLRKAKKYVKSKEGSKMEMESLIGHDWQYIKDRINNESRS